jgi:hypothetical protein
MLAKRCGFQTRQMIGSAHNPAHNKNGHPPMKVAVSVAIGLFD